MRLDDLLEGVPPPDDAPPTSEPVSSSDWQHATDAGTRWWLCLVALSRWQPGGELPLSDEELEFPSDLRSRVSELTAARLRRVLRARRREAPGTYAWGLSAVHGWDPVLAERWLSVAQRLLTVLHPEEHPVLDAGLDAAESWLAPMDSDDARTGGGNSA